MIEEQIFVEAIERPTPHERAAFVDQACAGDRDLHARVALLLEAHEHPDEFLNPPFAQLLAEPASQALAPGAGTVIGPYKLLEQIGEGGFGAVFMAEQNHPVRRKVALKILKPGMDTRQVIARFEAERQVLALMDHPNIARILDAGTVGESGSQGDRETKRQGEEAAATDVPVSLSPCLPYFVMELVRGIPVTQFCDKNRLPIGERLELFLQVGRAVQHAHQKGVIHRDIKPGNVLVTLHDGTPVIKVIDFGIAKAIGQQLTDRTLFTGFTQIVGTPLYMSPEQAEMSGMDVDTRTDVYSLGVLLYELLTGTTPFDQQRLRSVAYDEMRRIIREEEPFKPSTKVTQLGLEATTVSANRRVDLPKLRQSLRGELDWIVMMALEKDRTRRYESASALTADVERYLHDEPVQACPPSASYRMRKFWRRNRGPVAAAALVLITLLAGVAVSTQQAIRAYKAESLAQSRLETEQYASRDAIAQRSKAEANLRRARQAVDDYFTLVSEDILLEQPGLQDLRKKLLESALKYYESFVRQGGDDPQVQAELAAAYFRVAKIREAVDSPDASWAAFNLCLDLVERLQRDPRCTASALTPLAGVHKSGRMLHRSSRPLSDPALALRLLQRAADLWEKLARDHPAIPAFRSDLAGLYASIAEVQAGLGWRNEAIGSYQRSCEILQTLVDQDSKTPAYRADLASVFDRLGRQWEITGRNDEALTVRRQALQFARELVDSAPHTPYYEDLLAGSYESLGNSLSKTNPSEAEDALRQSIEIYRNLINRFPGVPAFREGLAVGWFDLSNLLSLNERPDEAAAACAEAVTIFERLASDSPANSDCRRRLATYQYTLGLCLYNIGRLDDADGAFRLAQIARRQLVSDFPGVARYHLELAWQLATCPDAQSRDPEAAVQLAAQAVELSPRNGSCWKTLGVAQYRAGSWAAAIEALEKSRQFPTFSRSCDWFLAMAYCQSGERDKARQHYEQAVQWMEKNGPGDPEQRGWRAEAEHLLATYRSHT